MELLKSIVSVLAFFCTMYCGYIYWSLMNNDRSSFGMLKRWGWLLLGFIGMVIFKKLS